MSVAAAVSGYGVRALVTGDDPDLLAALRSRFPAPITVEPTTPGDGGDGPVWVASDLDDVVGRVAPEIEVWIAEWAVDRVFVHAACVAVAGRSIVLPGRSHVGKTTLTEALLRHGAEYASDEFTVLDPAGMAHPYPRPLGVRDGGVRREVDPSELGAPVVRSPTSVTLVAHLHHEPGAATFGPASRASGAMALLDNTICAKSRPAEALSATANAVDGATVVRGARGDADDTARTLLSLLADC